MSLVSSQKVIPAFVLSFAVLTSSLSANAAGSSDKIQKPSDMPKASNGMINPPANPNVKDGVNLFFSIDALLLKAVEGGLDYAMKTPGNGIPSGSVVTGLQADQFEGFSGPTKCANYKWDWGFRADLGYNLPHDGWDLQLIWMHFNTKNSHTLSEAPFAAGGSALVATNETANGIGNTKGFSDAVYSNAHYALNLRTNFIDLRMGREFFVSKYLTVEPHFGARDGYINRNLVLTYGGASTLKELNGGVFKDTPHVLGDSSFLIQKSQNRFSGGGAFAGLDAEWGVGCGWSLYSTLDLALLYGKSQSKLTEYQADANNPRNTQTRFRTNVAEYDTRPMTDILAGVRWEHLFSQNAFRLRLQLGWEQHVVYGFNQRISALGINQTSALQYRNRNLTINGVSFQTRFDF